MQHVTSSAYCFQTSTTRLLSKTHDFMRCSTHISFQTIRCLNVTPQQIMIAARVGDVWGLRTDRREYNNVKLPWLYTTTLVDFTVD